MESTSSTAQIPAPETISYSTINQSIPKPCSTLVQTQPCSQLTSMLSAQSIPDKSVAKSNNIHPIPESTSKSHSKSNIHSIPGPSGEFSKSNSHSISQSTSEAISKPNVHPIPQSTSQSISQSTSQSTSHLISKQDLQSSSQSTLNSSTQSTSRIDQNTSTQSSSKINRNSSTQSTSKINENSIIQPTSKINQNSSTESTSQINQPFLKPILKKVPKLLPVIIADKSLPEVVSALQLKKIPKDPVLGATAKLSTKKLVKKKLKPKLKSTVKAVNEETPETVVETEVESNLKSVLKSPKSDLKSKKADNLALKSDDKSPVKSLNNVSGGTKLKSIPNKSGKSTGKSIVKSTGKGIVKSTEKTIKKSIEKPVLQLTAPKSQITQLSKTSKVGKVPKNGAITSEEKQKCNSDEKKDKEIKEEEEDDDEDDDEDEDEEDDEDYEDEEEDEDDDEEEEEEDSDDDIFVVELVPGSILIRYKTVRAKGKAKSRLKPRSAESRERSSGSPLRHLSDSSLGLGGLDEVTTAEVSRCRVTPPATTLPRFRKYSIQDFQFLKVLGKGSFGKVLLAELSGTECYYAVKCLKKDVVLEDDDVECTLIERKVLALGTNHPYLCHLFCTFQTESHLFFVMEYLNGGDLMFHIQQSGRFDEGRARFYASEIVSGLMFLHKKGIVYRDLKLDNILLDFDGHVRIADFGMCKLQIYLDRTADTFCGTPDYMAPEIIKGLAYNQCVDWWSFGILLYEMLVGQSPFSGCDEDDLFWSICNEQPHYPRFLSKESKLILSQLLEKDSSRRLGSSELSGREVTSHVFFRDWDWLRLERRQLDPPFKPRRHPLDVQYFDKAFTNERPRLTPIDKSILQSMDQTQFQGFSYTNPNVTK